MPAQAQIRNLAVALLAAAVLMAVSVPAAVGADFQHVIAPGETLTSVAATDGLTVLALAEANGISPNTELIAGDILLIPPLTPSTAAPVQTSAPVKATVNYPLTPPVKAAVGSPEPTAEYASAQEIADIANADGVPPALAEGVAWQESGWSNDVVSSVGAVGVMQIVPTTWTWINRYLTPADPLEPASAAENIRGGVLLLHDLLSLTDDNYTLAVASYYQGLASVREHGIYAQTQHYVDDVLALTARFGG